MAMTESDRARAGLRVLVQAARRAADSLSDRPLAGEPYRQRHVELDGQALADLRFALSLFDEEDLGRDLGLPLPSDGAFARQRKEPAALDREVARVSDQYAFEPVDLFGHSVLVVNASMFHEEVAAKLLKSGADIVMTYYSRDLGRLVVQLYSKGNIDVAAIARHFGGSGTREYAVIPHLPTDFNVLSDLSAVSTPEVLWSGRALEPESLTPDERKREEFMKRLVADTIRDAKGEAIVHSAGPVDNDVQLCVRCGKPLVELTGQPHSALRDGPVTVWPESKTLVAGYHGVGRPCRGTAE